jgi:SAM-dependent methyltransferase
MMNEKEKERTEIVREHYVQQAKEHELSRKSTMKDLNTRKLEIENILSYVEDGDACLEAGCGNGFASIEVLKHKKISLLGIDMTEEMIELARRQPIDGIKGSAQFMVQNILNWNKIESFDTVYTIRCLINLPNWESQANALGNLARAVKPGGKLIILEAYADGLRELNQARKEFGLEQIHPAYPNIHLEKKLVEDHLSKYGLKLWKEDNFLSTYYYFTRVLYPALASANNCKIEYNSKFAEFFSHINLPPYGNFAHIKTLSFRKKP